MLSHSTYQPYTTLGAYLFSLFCVPGSAEGDGAFTDHPIESNGGHGNIVLRG
jgi:hypothetical protein